MSNTKRLAIAWSIAACVAAGCGDEGPDHEHPGQHGGQGHPEAGSDAHASAPCPESIPDFVATASAGLEVTGTSKRISAKLIDADWSPPYKGDNEWDVLFLDAAGEPIDDLEIKEALTFMPVHGHPGKKTPVASKLDEPGVMHFEDVNLFMGGPWQVIFKVASETAAGSDEVIFEVCVNDN
jgi:hypothetical protein